MINKRRGGCFMHTSIRRNILRLFTMSAPSGISKPSPERTAEILESLADIRSRVQAVSSHSPASKTLVAVSKLKDASDILACYEGGQRDFGENYFQELADKALKVRRHSCKCYVISIRPMGICLYSCLRIFVGISSAHSNRTKGKTLQVCDHLYPTLSCR